MRPFETLKGVKPLFTTVQHLLLLANSHWHTESFDKVVVFGKWILQNQLFVVKDRFQSALQSVYSFSPKLESLHRDGHLVVLLFWDWIYLPVTFWQEGDGGNFKYSRWGKIQNRHVILKTKCVTYIFSKIVLKILFFAQICLYVFFFFFDSYSFPYEKLFWQLAQLDIPNFLIIFWPAKPLRSSPQPITISTG